jgi:sialate O-acetylesterase
MLAGVSGAELSLAPIFNDGAVLQCEMPVNVWGEADPGAIVTVSFAGQEKTAVASESGEWQVKLDPMKPSTEPRSLQVSSLPVATLPAVASRQPLPSAVEFQVSLSNVVVGEVWLASGQSNMAFALGGADGGTEWLAKTLPDIRFVMVPTKTGLPVEGEFTPAQMGWKIFTPGQNGGMSAVCFYFSEHLRQGIGRPVGILQSASPGTPCEAWTPEWALDAHPELKHMADIIRKGVAAGRPKAECVAEVEGEHQWFLANREWQKTKGGPAPVHRPVEQGNPWFQRSPVVLYENMIAPLLPYTARGVIWYQGENNTGRSQEYRILFPAMIEAWRKAADRPDWPFLFVQLPAYGHPNPDWSRVRAAQAFTRDTVPNTGMAVTIDLGEKENIHPASKQPVGKRLALLALDQVYKQNVVSRGPAFQSLEKKDGKLFVIFQCSEKQTGGGSASFQGSDPSEAREALLYSQQGSDHRERQHGLKTSDGKAEVPGFEIAGADGKFYPAQARIVSKDAVELICAEVEKPESVRYACHNWVEPPVTLQNRAGLPAEPFQATLKK